ncbi:hypothetical protein FQZ97_759010 [compost metagenome]
MRHRRIGKQWTCLSLAAGFTQELHECRSIDELEVAAAGERGGLLREAPGGHYEAACCAVRGHHAIELPYCRDADLEGFPLLALNEGLLSGLGENQIHATIGSATTDLLDRIPASPESFTNQQFELLPRYVLQRVGTAARGDRVEQGASPPTTHRRHDRAEETDHRQQILTYRGQALPDSRRGQLPDLLGGLCRGRGARGNRMQQPVTGERQHHARPPGQQGHQIHEVLDRAGLAPSRH